MVLQNGTSSADVSSLSGDHAVSVEAVLADSIEILRGPATLLYGGGAIGGVVNILDNRIPTKLTESTTSTIEYRHDSASDMDVVVFRNDGSSGNFAWHVDALYRDFNNLDIPGLASHEEDGHDEEEEEHEEEENTDGFIDNTSGLATNFTLGGSYHFDKGFFGLAISQLENEYGIPGGGHGHDEEEGDEEEEEEEGGIRLDVEQTRYDAALHLHNPTENLEVLRAFLSYTDYEHAEVEPNGEIGTLFNNETIEGRLEIVHQPIAGFHGVSGLQVKTSDFSALGEEAFVPQTDSTNIGIFLLEDYHQGDWLFEAGLRLDWDERDPDSTAASSEDFTAFSLSGSALWDIDPNWQLGLSLSRAERAPSTEELFSNVENPTLDTAVEHAATGAIEIGDPDLDTETSYNTDVSLRWNSGQHNVKLTAFYNDFSDYINLVNNGEEVDETPVLRYTQEDAEFYGLELDSEFALAEIGEGQLRVGFFGDMIRGELDNGDDIPRLPPTRIGTKLSWESDKLTLWTQAIRASSQDRPGENEEETDSYTRWDAGADYQLSSGDNTVNLFVSLNNISDQEIRLSTSFLREIAPEAGRSVEAGIRLSF